ncbi:MAG: uracil-DNA glycosylase [Bacilli bacterium]
MDIDELTKQIENCQNCDLCKTRHFVVVGSGNINSKIMIIGEGPGKDEDMCGTAFVGVAGKLLDKQLESIGLDRSMVYITNIVKCRPPGNRNPSPEEQEKCLNYLREQFLIMRPQLIILLGAVASKKLLDANFRITKQHGQIFTIKGVDFVPTYHPAALLRDPSKKPDAWHDLLVIKTIINRKGLLIN